MGNALFNNQSSNLRVLTLNIANSSIYMTNHHPKGCGQGHMTYFYTLPYYMWNLAN